MIKTVDVESILTAFSTSVKVVNVLEVVVSNTYTLKVLLSTFTSGITYV